MVRIVISKHVCYYYKNKQKFANLCVSIEVPKVEPKKECGFRFSIFSTSKIFNIGGATDK